MERNAVRNLLLFVDNIMLNKDEKAFKNHSMRHLEKPVGFRRATIYFSSLNSHGRNFII
jgi:hypothetical protein